LFVGAFFTPALTPPLAARWSDIGPTLEARSNTAPASALPPLRHCHGFSFRWVVECAPAHGSLSPQFVKRAANGRMTDSGFKKSYENNKSK
jgi:hypothetical protein